MPKRRRPPKEMTIENLEVPRVYEAPRLNKTREGRIYRLTLQKFLFNLFHFNEQLPRLKKLTDAAIRVKVIEEYARYKKTVDYWKGDPIAVLNARTKYNRGIFTEEPPEFLSFRYDADGNKMLRNSINFRASSFLMYVARNAAVWLEEPGKWKENIPIRDWFPAADDEYLLKAYEKLHKKRKNRNAR